MMKLVFGLPEEVVDLIFAYHDPYKYHRELFMYDLRWNQFWYHCFCNWFVRQNLDYPSYVLRRNNSNKGNCLRI